MDVRFPKGWDKVIITVPLGHQDALRICRLRAFRDIRKWIDDGCPKGKLNPDRAYKINIAHMKDQGVSPMYATTHLR